MQTRSAVLRLNRTAQPLARSRCFRVTGTTLSFQGVAAGSGLMVASANLGKHCLPRLGWAVAHRRVENHRGSSVAHDWGGAHVMSVVMTGPERVRSWVCDVIGLFDQDYQWHDRVKVSATPGAGEDAVAGLIGPPVSERAAALVDRGMHEDVALPVAEGQNVAMGDCILRLYRDAVQPTMARLGRNLERAAARPGLSILAGDDHYAPADQRRPRERPRRCGGRGAGRTGPLVVHARPRAGCCCH